MRVEPERILAFRLAAQELAEPAGSMLAAAASWAVQDSPPGSAALALHARVADLDPGELERRLLDDRTLVALYNPRSAVAVVPAADAATYATAFAPRDDDSLEAFMARAVVDEALAPEAAQELAVDAVGGALDGRTLTRDELHEELRRRLPEAMLPWCQGCGSHHARRPVLNAAAAHGVLCLAGHEGRQPRFARTDQWLREPVVAVDAGAAAAELVRRYLHRYGPSTPRLLAEWWGVHRAHTGWAWGLVEGDLVEVDVAGRTAWLLAGDRRALEQAERPAGVRLLPPGDPLLQGRDRELLLDDTARRREVWGGVGAPGVVLLDGELAGTWRPRKQGRRLTVAVTPFRPLRAQDRSRLEAAAEAAAPHRGCSSGAVTFAADPRL